ncbi:SAM-dependent methyltransferase [Sedimentitalea sp. JM2-8]|uniref:SAM-dependent methyltransferase n=1 Tax=Sedimentitalea xiamensis TaxID=3050037 RepID=A0ABT7FEF1_9RHOB|nr:SAM-dependent methyltransferase [Sedimentitalea xiamensis]MDK3073199.1 SAM-dependent methyltransferase [Sedimentitalea xiamensis]
MTLAQLIIDRIRQDGPISIANYMADCLLHPVHGYYTTHDPFGAQGDFVTAPEISQMFGEMVGLCLAQTWMDQGRPAPIALAELGPGRGTLMADILRATRSVPGFHAAARIALVEASPGLRAVQKETLGPFGPVWLDRAEALPDLPLFAVANEFFDALPVRQFVRAGPGWRERRIGVQDDALVFGLGTPAAQADLADRLADTKDGDLVEIRPAAEAIATCLARRIADHGGAALIIDYGDWRSQGDTLQAVRAHESCDVLDAPGQADLTAHVDFEAIAIAAGKAGCAHSRLAPQGVFLERLGITARAQALAAADNLTGTALDLLVSAHRRLTHPDEMGNLFKILGLYPHDCATPPGLDP